MKVAVIPDAAMIVVPLIEKNGHEYIYIYIYHQQISQSIIIWMFPVENVMILRLHIL